MKITCPICQGEYSNLKTHMTKKHHLGWDEFQKAFGHHESTSEEAKSNRSEASRRLWKDESYRESHSQMFSDRMKYKWADNTYREAKTAEAKRTFSQPNLRKAQSEAVSEANRKRWSDAGFRERFVQSLRDRWNNDDIYFQKMSQGMTDYNNSVWSDPSKVAEIREKTCKRSRGIVSDYIKKNGSTVKLRSRLEARIARAIEACGYDFEYESIKVNYSVNGKGHVYYPDFYIPALDLVLEVKPKNCISDLAKIKLDSARQSGYNIRFVSSITQLKGILGVTTIESIANS